MRTAAILLVIIFFAPAAPAQYNFIHSGVIHYEKRTNQFKILDASGIDQNTIDIAKQGASKILADHFELQFSEDHSVYRLAAPNNENKYFVLKAPPDDDRVVKDLSRNELFFQRTLLGNTYMVHDSLNHYDWKILNETRTIAGFECKKAVARVFDSVYVVAFFTTEILPSNGPESFSGLPGMILEVAVPRLYTTWIATSVAVKKLPEEQLAIPQASGKISNREYFSALYQQAKDLPPLTRNLLWMYGL